MAYTYTQLVSEIQAWTEDDNTEFASAIPAIIANAETRIAREAPIKHWQTSTTVTATAYANTFAYPTNAVVLRYVRNNTGDFLRRKDETFMNELAPTPTAYTGTPAYYSDQDAGRTVEFAPTSTASVTLDVGYVYREALSTSVATSYLGQYAPDLLLAACLVEAGPFLRMEDNDTAKYMARYQERLASFVAEENTRRFTDEYERK